MAKSNTRVKMVDERNGQTPVKDTANEHIARCRDRRMVSVRVRFRKQSVYHPASDFFQPDSKLSIA